MSRELNTGYWKRQVIISKTKLFRQHTSSVWYYYYVVSCHGSRAPMRAVWEAWGEWPGWTGCVIGRPSGITSHQARTTIWSCLFQDSLPFETHPHSLPAPPRPAPIHWCTLHGYWPLICFRSLALFLYDLHHPKNNGTPHALNVFKYWSAHLPQSHERSLRKGIRKNTHTHGRVVRQKPTQQKEEEEKKMGRNLTAF